MPDSQVRDSAPRFACITEPDDSGAAWVHLAGELDMYTTPQLVWTLSEPLLVQAPLVVIDLRDLTFIDTAGLDAIVAANVRARRRDRRLLVVRGTPHVHQIFTLTKAAGELEILDLEAFDPRDDETA
jgi:anti-anti-sigma factor